MNDMTPNEDADKLVSRALADRRQRPQPDPNWLGEADRRHNVERRFQAVPARPSAFGALEAK